MKDGRKEKTREERRVYELGKEREKKREGRWMKEERKERKRET
jgi:hypothetical protein